MARRKSDPTKKKYTGEKFGRRLKEIRETEGMSTQRLADEVGVSKNYISNLESGQRVPSFDVLISMINTLDTSADLLVRDYLNQHQKTLLRSVWLEAKMSELSEDKQQHLEKLITLEIEYLKK